MSIAETETHKRKLEEVRKRWQKPKTAMPQKFKRESSTRAISVTPETSEEVARHLAVRREARQFCERNCDNVRGIHHFMCVVTLWQNDAGRKLLAAAPATA